MNVLITGATSGIGFALTEKLIKNGHKVFLGVHTKNEVKTTLKKVKEIDYLDRVTVLKLDITKKDDRNIIKEIEDLEELRNSFYFFFLTLFLKIVHIINL